jgi:hypothetical protein
MTKYFKSAISILVLVFFLPDSFGQQPANYPDFLAERFMRYCRMVPREEIYVHTDREDFIAGEDLYFKMYLIDRQSAKPSGNSKIAYFELLNSENRPVVQKRIKLEEGFGHGQIILPDTLSTGIYILRVYTNWMKNFLPYNCFMKNINIYNALRTKADTNKSDYINTLKDGNGTDYGHLINDTIPVLKVNNLKTNAVDISVSASKNFFSANGDLFYLFIQTQGKINHISTEIISGENTIISVPKRKLIPGINHITLFDSKGQPLCERLIYTPDIKMGNMSIESPGNYKTRQKISVELEPGQELPTTLNRANLSISVSPVTDKTEMMDLNDYMVFGSEFGTLPLRVFSKAKINELPAGLTDSILSSLKSNWIDWKVILSDNLPSFRYKMEKEDHYLSGKLFNSKTQVPEPGRVLFLSIPGKVATFQYTKTDNDGNFSFHIQIGEVVKDIIIQPEETGNATVKIESSFSGKYPETIKVIDTSKKAVPKYISQLKINYQVNKIYGSSSLGNPVTTSVLPSNPIRFYGKPDIELFMADYIKLPVMQEVFSELLPGVFLKNKKSGYEISIVDPVTNEVFEKQPLLLIDGVIIDDPSIIANLDPEIVEKIDVVKEKYYVGEYSFYGLVNIISKTGDFSCVPLPSYAIRMPYRVVDPVLSFVFPDYTSAEMKNNRIPDFRSTLYWNPSVMPDKSGKIRLDFWSSDIASDYEINVQGITPEGNHISFRKIIKVKKKYM